MAVPSFFLALQAQARSYPEWSLNLSSSLRTTFFSHHLDDTNQELIELEITPTYRWKNSDSWRAFLKPTIVLSPNNKSIKEQTFTDLGEAYVRYQSDLLTIQAGSTFYSWGVTDGYNPLDIINSRQYFDPIRSRKLGAPSISLSRTEDSWDYEIIWIPKNQEAQLPGNKSRWLPRQIYIPETQNNDLILILPKSPKYEYSSRQSLNDALENNFALRFQKRSSFIDFSLSFFEGAATFPLIEPEVTGSIIQISPKTVISVDPEITLHSKNFRLRQVGFSSVFNMDSFLLKIVSSYSQSIGDHPLLPGWAHESILGFEKVFDIGREATLIAILQHSYINSERDRNSNLSATEFFRRGWMLGGRLSWKELWTFSALTLYDSLRGSHFEEISLTRRLRDVWMLEVNSRFIEGAQDTPLGVYDKNDSLNFSISRTF